MSFVMKYAMEHQSMSKKALHEAYMLEGYADPFDIILDRCVNAGYLQRSPIPNVLLSGFTTSGRLKCVTTPQPQCN